LARTRARFTAGLGPSNPGELLLQHVDRFDRGELLDCGLEDPESPDHVSRVTAWFARSICFFGSSSILPRIAAVSFANGVSLAIFSASFTSLIAAPPVLLVDLRARLPEQVADLLQLRRREPATELLDALRDQLLVGADGRESTMRPTMVLSGRTSTVCGV